MTSPSSRPHDQAAQAAQGNVVGNHEAKYDSPNPIARALVGGFLEAAHSLVADVRPRRVVEFGCGEGRLAQLLVERAATIEDYLATDVELLPTCGVMAQRARGRLRFDTASVYAPPPQAAGADLIVCCEVLEHLEDPARALDALADLASGALLVSTPREPLWRAMNLARGRYVTAWGNTPGHIQHFSTRGLLALVRARFDVVQVRTPIPWTMVLARPRRGAAS